MIIPKHIYLEAVSHVRRESSQESCGLFLSNQAGTLTRVIACKNLQDELHQENALHYPRTSKTAYFIDPKQLFQIQKEMRSTSEHIAVIYHSHINAGAYFSEEDHRLAVLNDEPLYPNVKYLIFSLIKGKVKENALYAWHEKNRKFQKEEIE